MKAKDIISCARLDKETSEQTLHRQQQSREHMASMRAAETSEQTLHRQQQSREYMASMRAVSAEGSALQCSSFSLISDFHRDLPFISARAYGISALVAPLGVEPSPINGIYVISRYARGEAGGGGGGGVVSCPDREGKTVGCTRIGILAQPIIYFLHPKIA